MSDGLPLDAARRVFADAIRTFRFVPDSIVVSIRADPELGDAAAFQCSWPLIRKGPITNDNLREITVRITTGAMNHFRSAMPRERGDMLMRFERVFRARLYDEQYNLQNPPSPPFIVEIDEHSLER